MKKIILLLITLVLLTSCAKNNTDNIKFKKEYESQNSEEIIAGENYRKLDISKNNSFVYSNGDEIVNKIENKETFYVYIGSSKCPWCRSVIEKFIEIANLNNIDKVYYVDIWSGDHQEILRDKYTLDENNKPKKTVDGTESYYKLLNYFDEFLSDYTLTTSKGKTVKVGEKRILAPTFVYIEEGVTKKLVTGISDKQTTYNAELTNEILEDEENTFKEFLSN